MSFDKAFEWLIRPDVEGGYVNDPKDSGGETNMGISRKAYPCVDIKNLTVEAAKAIYLRDYWNVCLCSKMPESLDIVVFDCAVNQGAAKAIKLLQRTLKVKVDGIIGNKTLAAINNRNINNLIVDFMASRAFSYAVTNLFGFNCKFKRFGFGWMRRLFNLMRYITWK